MTVYFYIWNKKEYLTSELFDLIESEKQEINHQVIDEIEEKIKINFLKR
ncbi:Rep protein [Staphylococcus borealis]|nr:Rep protein [Staphylococcus borealis]MDO0995800.1 Rep protein [Staphylococcus borealis]